MKNWVIVLLIVVIFVLLSFLYRKDQEKIYYNFPLNDVTDEEFVENRFYLFLFFSKQNCKPCLEVIEELNRLPEQFQVFGIVPEDELIDEKELREITGARFTLKSAKKFKKFTPIYAPTLIGVSKHNKIFFIIPGVPNEFEYLEQFLNSFYEKAYSLISYY
jgi:hypothetical protein